jgi:hypothetical protein
MYSVPLTITGIVLILSTIKRPTMLGGPPLRYAADEGSVAMLNRWSRQRLGIWLLYPGVLFWLFGL